MSGSEFKREQEKVAAIMQEKQKKGNDTLTLISERLSRARRQWNGWSRHSFEISSSTDLPDC
jgi:hypothetical protein